MDNKKVCFITCVNNHELYKKSLFCINNLEVPKGFKVEKICIENAEYLTKEYDKAMKETDAKYKVYIHQDVYIINKNFIKDIIDIFENNRNIGMMGVVGTKVIPKNGIWWESSYKCGMRYSNYIYRGMKLIEYYKQIENESVKCIDGLIMITQYDIPWRKDIFDGWHFYDISQSVEFIKAGYEVVVPKQKKVWCIHDEVYDRDPSSDEYHKYRKIFLKEYHEYI